MNAAAYARMLKSLLPQGLLWRADPDSWLSKVMLGFADELVRAEGRGDALIEETDPRTATETLEDWERVLGLPDEDVMEIPATDAARRLAIVQKLIRRGGQTPVYFVSLALACGWVVYVAEGYGDTVFRVGRARVGERLRGVAWAYAWRVDVDYAPGVSLTSDELERIIRRVAPAHTTVIFNYL